MGKEEKEDIVTGALDDGQELSRLFDNKEDNPMKIKHKSSQSISKKMIRSEARGDVHDEDLVVFPEEINVRSPEDMDAFHAAIRKIGYTVEDTLNNKDGTFVVKNSKGVEVLKGNKDTCQMSSPLDKQVLQAYLNAHKGKEIIVDRCKTKQAAQQLLDACKNNVPPVGIKFPDGMLEKFGFDNWVCLTHSLPPAEPTKPEIAIKSSGSGMKKI